MPLSTTLNTRSRFAVETGCGRTLRPSFRRSRTSVAGAIFVRFNGQGEIEEERRYFDMASMMAQLGVTADQP